MLNKTLQLFFATSLLFPITSALAQECPASAGSCVQSQSVQSTSLDAALLATQWRTASELLTMSEEDKRNTVIVGLNRASTATIAMLQTFNNTKLIAHAQIYAWLKRSTNVGTFLLRAMSLADQRNTIIAELHSRTGMTVATLQSMTDQTLVTAADLTTSNTSAALLEAKWRTINELLVMSDNDKRNTVIVSLANASNASIPALQALNDVELTGSARVYSWLRDVGARTAVELNVMSLDNQRNTIITELHLRTGSTVATLQAMSNQSLAAKARLHSALLSTTLLEAGWRSVTQLANMSDNDVRNTLIVELSNVSTASVPALQGLNSEQLMGSGRVYTWLRDSLTRTVSELSLMSLSDQRNTIIAESFARTATPVASLQAQNNITLATNARFNSLQLDATLLEANWRTVSELNTMSEHDKRNTVIVGLHTVSLDSIAALQALSNEQLIGSARVYAWLRDAKIRNEAELKVMSLDNHRNTLIAELSVRKGIAVAALQAMSNQELAVLARQ